LQRALAMVERVIATDTRVLVTGETGTGKELVARAIHYNGPRADAPFLSVNCAAFTAELLASELFGHRKGGFTGAHEDRAGLFKAADGGTLFLDEIGDCSLELQAHVLRALDRGEIRRVGDDKPFIVDVRVIAATNKDLEEEARAGRFRQDLFFRLSVFTVHLPPLRERSEDVALLADHFLRHLARKHGKQVNGFTFESLARLSAHRFPGNVRELENEVERAFTLAEPDGYVTPDLLSPKFAPDRREGATGEQGRFYDAVARYETQLIRDALARNDGSRVQAAKDLGIARETLFAKMRKYGIDRH
jgi:transcriptional regulator with PAS, ATPase and Fis domain